jgi:hypothetical protein
MKWTVPDTKAWFQECGTALAVLRLGSLSVAAAREISRLFSFDYADLERRKTLQQQLPPPRKQRRIHR